MTGYFTAQTIRRKGNPSGSLQDDDEDPNKSHDDNDPPRIPSRPRGDLDVGSLRLVAATLTEASSGEIDRPRGGLTGPSALTHRTIRASRHRAPPQPIR